MKKYKDYHDLIILGHNAHLTPKEIHERFIEGGLPPDTVPPVHTIRVLGCHLVGPGCRWHHQGRMVSWSGGGAVKDNHLNGRQKKLLVKKQD